MGQDKIKNIRYDAIREVLRRKHVEDFDQIPEYKNLRAYFYRTEDKNPEKHAKEIIEAYEFRVLRALSEAPEILLMLKAPKIEYEKLKEEQGEITRVEYEKIE